MSGLRVILKLASRFSIRVEIQHQNQHSDSISRLVFSSVLRLAFSSVLRSVESNGWDMGDEEEERAEAAVEADYQQSQRIRQQAETERMLQVMDETRERGEFEEILAKWADCCASCKGAEDKADHRMEELD